MLLSFFANSADIAIRRDGPFQNLGFVAEHRPQMLSFLENPRFLSVLLKNTTVSAVLTTPELQANIPQSLALGICEQPRIAFGILHNRLTEAGFYREDTPTHIHPQADVHPRAFVAEKNITVGSNSTVGPNATVLERCSIGSNVTVSAGAVLGGAGFQAARTPDTILEMRHAGGLLVHDGAHILHGAVIATGLFRNDTEIGRDARIGAQAFLSHGVQVGERSFIGHGAVINGNVSIGDGAWIGPGAVIAQNLTVGNGAFVSMGSIVIRDVEAHERVSGNFAVGHRKLLRHMATME